MNESAVIAIFLGILLFNPTSESLASNENVTFDKNLEYAYNVTTSIIDDVKESIFTIKLKCRERSIETVACRLEDPQYQTIYHVSPCNKSIDLCSKEHLGADNSYIGRFDIKYNSSSVESLITSPETSLKQLSFYRVVADLIFPGVDVSTQPEGTYSLLEQSVYGKCQALVKVVRSRIKIDVNETRNSGKLVFFPRGKEIRNNDDRESSQHYGEMLSVKRTRNLETCYPVPGLLIFDAFFYHPMMTSVHYDLKSSISRIIVRDRAFTSYTTEEIAMKNIEKPGGNTTMLHVRTTLELHSIDRVDKPIPPIFDPISVDLPFVNGFNAAEKSDSASSPNDASTNIVKNNDSMNNDTRNNDSNRTGQ